MYRRASRKIHLRSSQPVLVSKRSLDTFPPHLKMALSSSYSSTTANRSRPIQLIVDFDGTLTRKDTMHLVADIGYSRQEQLKREPQPRPWKEIVNAYIGDFQNHADQYKPKPADRTSLQQEITWLNSLKPVEDASMVRALQEGIFDDVRRDDVHRSVRVAVETGKVELRDGWNELFSHIWHHNSQCSHLTRPEGLINILSVTWSKHFIKAVLGECASWGQGSNVECGAVERKIAVYANEIPSVVKDDFESESYSKNQIFNSTPSFKIQTSGDKANIFREITSSSTEHESASTSIYIGDSTTDLQCLAAADFGICVRDQPMGGGQKDLAETCRRIGIEVKRLDDQSRLGNTGSSRDCLFWAEDFKAVKQWLISQHLTLNPR